MPAQLVVWSATKTVTGSATSAARRDHCDDGCKLAQPSTARRCRLSVRRLNPPLDTAPPFLTYNALGGLPQDPQCGAESCPRSQEVAEGGVCKVRDLLSTYRFRGGVEPMVGLAVQQRGLGAEGRLCALRVPQPTDLIGLSLIVLGRRLRTARLGAVRPTFCDRQLWRRFTERPIVAARTRI